MDQDSKHASPAPADAFHYRLRVRYYECDAQKVVFNARYGDYVDLAVLEFMRACGLAKTLVDGPLDYQLVKQTLEWKAPARFDSVLDISVRTLRLGNASFTIGVEFRIVGDERVIAQAETVYVLIEAVTLAKATLRDDLRAAITRGAPGVVVDHANCRPV